MTRPDNILFRTLLGEKTDRVPVSPFIHMNYVDEYFQHSGCDPVEKTIKVYDRYGFDVIFRNCTVDYLDERCCDSRDWRVTVDEKIFEPGMSWQNTYTIRTPERELHQTKKFSRSSKYEVVEAITEYYIKDEEDFLQFVKFQPPTPEYDGTNIRRAKELLAGRGLVAPWAQGAFNMTSMYRKLDDLLMDPYLEEELYNAMMTYFSQRMVNVIEQYAKDGADMICCGGNVANGGVVGPEYFSRFILPFETGMAKKVRSLGAFHLYHNCGDAKKLLPLYSQIGMDMYESMTPKPYGDTVLETALAVIDPSITLSGNIDQIDLLRKGSVEMIDEAVKTTLTAAKKRGNFILAATDYFNDNTPEKNIAAFAEAAAKYGRYQ